MVSKKTEGPSSIWKEAEDLLEQVRTHKMHENPVDVDFMAQAAIDDIAESLYESFVTLVVERGGDTVAMLLVAVGEELLAESLYPPYDIPCLPVVHRGAYIVDNPS